MKKKKQIKKQKRLTSTKKLYFKYPVGAPGYQV